MTESHSKEPNNDNKVEPLKYSRWKSITTQCDSFEEASAIVEFHSLFFLGNYTILSWQNKQER